MGLFDLQPDSTAFGIINPSVLGLLAGLGQASAPSRMPVPFGSVIGQAAAGLLGGQEAGLKMQGEQQKLTQGNAALGQLLDQMRMAAKYYGAEAPSMADLKAGKFEGLLSKGFPTPTTPTQQPAVPAPLALQSQPQQPQQPQQPLGALAAASPAGGTPQAQPAVNTGGPPDALLTAIHRNESGGRIEGVPDSKAGAVGPMQVLPSTAAQYGVSPDELRNPAINLSVGKQYATDLWQKYNGDPEAVAVAYNAGPRRADIWLASGKIDKLLPEETQGYLTKVRNQLGGEGAQYAQNTANPATMTDAGGAASSTQAPAAGVMDPVAIRQGLAAQQYMFPGTKTTPALDALLSAGMMPANSSAQRLLMNEALKAGGLEPQNLRQGGALIQYDPVTLQPRMVIQNPRLGEGQHITPQGNVENVPGYLPSATARESAIDWSKVPPKSFLKGLRVNPDMSVSPVPGSPQAEATMSGAKAGGEAAARAGVQFGPLLGGGQAPGEPTQLAPQAGAPQGASQPIPSQSRFGTLIPPPTPTSQPQFSSPAEAEKAMTKWGETFDKWNEAVAPAAQAEQRLNTIADAFKIIQSGKFVEQKANLAAIAKSLGIDASRLLGDPAAAELALHENYVSAIQRLKAVNSRFTQQELRTLSSVTEHPNLQPEANLQMISEDIATLRRAQALPLDWSQAHAMGWRDPHAFEAAWNQSNKLSDSVAAIKKEIGPLKGMEGAQGNQAPPASQRPVTAVGPNGHRIELRNGAWVDQVTGKPVQ